MCAQQFFFQARKTRIMGDSSLNKVISVVLESEDVYTRPEILMGRVCCIEKG